MQIILSILKVGELELNINHHKVTFKGKKDEKGRVLKAHIGSKILTFVVQDRQINIQPASVSNSESDIDRVERIVGSSQERMNDLVALDSSELNHSGGQAADSSQEQQAEEKRS